MPEGIKMSKNLFAHSLLITLILLIWIISSAVLVVLALFGGFWLFTELYNFNLNPIIFVALFFVINLASVLWLVLANRKCKNQK